MNEVYPKENRQYLTHILVDKMDLTVLRHKNQVLDEFLNSNLKWVIYT